MLEEELSRGELEGVGVIDESDVVILDDNLLFALWGGSYLVDGMEMVRRCLVGFCFSSFLVPKILVPRYLNIEPE